MWPSERKHCKLTDGKKEGERRGIVEECNFPISDACRLINKIWTKWNKSTCVASQTRSNTNKEAYWSIVVVIHCLFVCVCDRANNFKTKVSDRFIPTELTFCLYLIHNYLTGQRDFLYGSSCSSGWLYWWDFPGSITMSLWQAEQLATSPTWWCHASICWWFGVLQTSTVK